MHLHVEDGETFLHKFDDYVQDWDGLHMFEDPDNPRRKSTILERILTRSEHYKFFMRQRTARRIASRFETEAETSKQYKYRPQVLEELQAIYYGSKWTDAQSSFVIERSFSVIDWKRAELIQKRKNELFENLT